MAPAPRSPLALVAEPSARRTDDPPVTLQTQRQTQQDSSEAPQVHQDQQTRHRRQGQGSQRTSFCTKMQKHYKRKRGNARPQPHCSEPTLAVATPRTKCMAVEWRESMDDFDTERTHLVAQLCKDHPADCAFPMQDQDGGGGATEKGKPWRYVQALRDLALHGRPDEPPEEDSEPTLPFQDPTEGTSPTRPTKRMNGADLRNRTASSSERNGGPPPPPRPRAHQRQEQRPPRARHAKERA